MGWNFLSVTIKNLTDYISSINFLPNYDQAKSLNVDYRNGNKQIITLPSGYDYIHALLIVGDKMYAVTRDATVNKFIRFNNLDDLTDYDQFTIPYGGSQLTWVKEKGLLYIHYVNTSTSNTQLRIGAVDPTTLALTLPIDVTLEAGSQPYAGSSCSDGTYLYVLTGGIVAVFIKYLLADYSRVSSVTATGFWGRGHAIIYDGTNLYASSNEYYHTESGNSSNNWIVKVDPVTMTITTRNDTFLANYPTGNNMMFTDDMCSVGDYLFVGVEQNRNGSESVLRIKKSDLTYDVIVIPGAPVDKAYPNTMCFGVQFDGVYVWAVYATTPGFIARIDPVTLEVNTATLDSGENAPNEIQFDGKRMFMCYWQAPAKVSRYYKLPLSGSTGTFTTVDSKTVTVTNGKIVSIV